MVPRWGSWPAAAALAVALLAGITAMAGAATPRCFGAAARDPARPCVNPRLRLTVTPTPRNAPLTHGTACTKLPPEGMVESCAFGAGPRGTFAIVGDSHAAHWRPALAVVAKRLGWHGIQVSRNGCALSALAAPLPEPYLSQCTVWKAQVLEWLARHPEVTTVFLAQKTTNAEDYAPNPPVPFATQVTGHLDAWNGLPATVGRVFVIRDNPVIRTSTFTCVSRAVARRRAPGPACAIPLRTALAPDPAMAAVAQLATPRFQSVDLTPHFCDARSCYPVVGGVLVYKDVNHLTRRFAETLGPFLLRATGLA